MSSPHSKIVHLLLRVYCGIFKLEVGVLMWNTTVVFLGMKMSQIFFIFILHPN